MMFSRSAGVLLSVATFLLAWPIASSRASGHESTPLESMAFLAGSCWQGAFRDRPAVTDEHCFEWVFDGKFLRDRHVVRGDAQPYEGETLYAWDAASKRIVYWYIARPGFHSTGHVEPHDGQLHFIDTVRQASGTRELRTVWTRTAADAFSVSTEEITGGTVKQLWAMEMRRVPKTGAPK